MKTVSKKAKRMDQEYVSKEEFAKERKLKAMVKAELRNDRKYILQAIEDGGSKQMVRRVNRSARRQKLGILGILEKLCGLG